MAKMNWDKLRRYKDRSKYEYVGPAKKPAKCTDRQLAYMKALGIPCSKSMSLAKAKVKIAQKIKENQTKTAK